MRKLAGLIILLCIGCSPKPKLALVHINIVNKSVQFTGLDNAILGDISRDSIADVWETLLPVYKMPADTGLKNYQPVQHGSYILKDSAVLFTPDTPFVKSQTYYMLYYQFDKLTTAWDFIRKGKKLGSLSYIDLSFKY